ncbi:MAG: SDR family NAD(P)-dependent oxidoreductase [Gammaproteobacteria bacterium]
MNDFKDKLVVITGGSRGIGFETARRFLEAGARVVFCGRTVDSVNAARTALFPLGTVDGMAVDLGDADATTAWAAEVESIHGAVDILVNNAGYLYKGPYEAETPRSIQATLNVNVAGVMLLTRALLPGMLARRSGVIVNVSSGAGLTGIPEVSSYCASKFAVVGFTASLAQETASRGVRVHGLCPGMVATDMQITFSGRKQGLEPGRVADAILALAGPNPPAEPGECLPLFK